MNHAMHDGLPWLTLLALGALHGLNPGMGWLFAVALGFQERDGRAVWRALPPLAAGHALAVGGALLVLFVLGAAIPPGTLSIVMGVALVGLGGYRMLRHRHPRLAGMQANARQLTTWSFVMASAHGAGLMVLPLLAGTLTAAAWLAAGIHTAGYLGITGLVAWLVYEKLGLRRLTSVWFNVDYAWALALVGTGAFVLLQSMLSHL